MKQQIIRQVTVGGDSRLDFSDENEGEGSLDLAPVTCAGNDTTDIVWAATIAQIRSLAIVVSGDCTVKTNSAGSPDDTLSFAGKRNYDWNAKSLAPLLLTEDVTSLHVVVGIGGGDVTIQIAGNYDPTP
jgi:hypothetical protein